MFSSQPCHDYKCCSMLNWWLSTLQGLCTRLPVQIPVPILKFHSHMIADPFMYNYVYTLPQLVSSFTHTRMKYTNLIKCTFEALTKLCVDNYTNKMVLFQRNVVTLINLALLPAQEVKLHSTVVIICYRVDVRCATSWQF